MSRPSSARLVIPLLVGAAVSLGLGVYAHDHDPTGHSIFSLVFTKTLNMKAWFATGALTLALFQVASGPRIYGLIGRGPAPSWLGPAHRVTGVLAFALTVPVAYHCLWALGWQDTTTRMLVHSIAGCVFFGAFAAKVLIVESKRMPGWALPVAGGALFATLVVIWWTSALWFFNQFGFPSF
jgi:hypothetical protein